MKVPMDIHLNVNFKVSLFFFLYDTPLGISTRRSVEWGSAVGGRGHNGKKVYFEMYSRQIKVFQGHFWHDSGVPAFVVRAVDCWQTT